MGRISQEWLTLQGSYTTIDDIYRESYVWASSIVEISLQQFMELWEKRNQDVHGKTEAQQQSRRLEKLQIKIRKLQNISSTKQIILHSIKAVAKAAADRTKNILEWFNRIPAMAPYTATPFWGPYFKGTYLPQNRVHCPHLEGER